MNLIIVLHLVYQLVIWFTSVLFITKVLHIVDSNSYKLWGHENGSSVEFLSLIDVKFLPIYAATQPFTAVETRARKHEQGFDSRVNKIRKRSVAKQRLWSWSTLGQWNIPILDFKFLCAVIQCVYFCALRLPSKGKAMRFTIHWVPKEITLF